MCYVSSIATYIPASLFLLLWLAMPLVSQVTIERMSVSDEMVVLASGALEEVVSPQEAALMVHTFGATKLAALREAFSLTADGEVRKEGWGMNTFGADEPFLGDPRVSGEAMGVR